MERDVAFTSPLVFTKRVIVGQKPAPLRSPEEIVQIAGTVLHGDAPVVGASITLVETGRATQSDALGRYTFANVPVGRYHLLVRAGNRESRHEVAVLPAKDAQFYDVRL